MRLRPRVSQAAALASTSEDTLAYMARFAPETTLGVRRVMFDALEDEP